MSVLKRFVFVFLFFSVFQVSFCSEINGTYEKYYEVYNPLWERDRGTDDFSILFDTWVVYAEVVKPESGIPYETVKEQFLKRLEAEKSSKIFKIADSIYRIGEDLDILISAVENDDALLAAESFLRYIYRRGEISRNSGRTYAVLLIFLSCAIVALIVFIVVYQRIFYQAKESETTLQITMNVQEVERNRISQELHDSVAQEMRYVSMLADSLGGEVAEEIKIRQKKCIEDIRAICYNLSPVDIERRNLKRALAFLCESFMKRTGLSINLTIADDVEFSALNFSKEHMHNIFRIVQELLMNIEKHAEASEVTVLFRNATELDGSASKGGLCIFVSDDGNGTFESKKMENNNDENLHFGLRNINARLKKLNATIEYNAIKGNGTDVKISIPYYKQFSD